MKKVLILLILFMNLTTVQAQTQIPQYKIIASSNEQRDIDEMYDVKNQLLLKYKSWAKGVDDVNQVLIDHLDTFHGQYKNGVYTIILGEGKGKSLTGKLQVSYCTTSKEIKKKSLIQSLFFSLTTFNLSSLLTRPRTAASADAFLRTFNVSV